MNIGMNRSLMVCDYSGVSVIRSYLTLVLFIIIIKGYRSSSSETFLRATGHYLPYGITQCYLPPDTSECAQP